MQVNTQSVRDGHAIFIPVNEADFIACTDFSLAEHTKIKTGAPAGKEALYHIAAIKFEVHFKARKSRLSDNHFGCSDVEAISEANAGLQQRLCREVFSKSTPRKIDSRQFFLPKGIMFGGIHIHGLVLSAVHG